MDYIMCNRLFSDCTAFLEPSNNSSTPPQKNCQHPAKQVSALPKNFLARRTIEFSTNNFVSITFYSRLAPKENIKEKQFISPKKSGNFAKKGQF